MKTKHQITIFGVFIFILFLTFGLLSINLTKNLSFTISHLKESSLSLQKSQDIDMMHDAIRADVFSTIIGVTNNNKKQIDESVEDLKTHSKRMKDNFDELLKQPLKKETVNNINSNIPVVEKYIKVANEIQNAKITNVANSDNLFIEFNKAFSELEDILEEQSTIIEKESHDIDNEAIALTQTSIITLSITLVIVSVILFFSFFLFIKILENFISKIMNITQSLEQLDLTNNIEINGNFEIKNTLQSISNMQSKVKDVIVSIKQSSENFLNSSLEIAQGNNDLSARTESQASAIEETSASMMELNSNVEHNTNNAQSANDLALQSSKTIQDCGNLVNDIVTNMQNINSSSKKISDIITVIDGIAFQTNILALNAAVEAARAGEQGRGFAVVASEVRSLAGKSAEAAKEIKSLINNSQTEVEKGNLLVEKTGAIMIEAVNSMKKVTDMMSEINSASSEQKLGMSQITEAVSQMDQVTQQNAALVEEMAAASSSLNQQSDDLVKIVNNFKI